MPAFQGLSDFLRNLLAVLPKIWFATSMPKTNINITIYYYMFIYNFVIFSEPLSPHFIQHESFF